MNFTLDDTASQLSFSSGWASQSPTDPDLPQFFQRTYHAVQSPGATLNMSIQGTGIYIYGSKGPNHADFNLQVDDEVFKLSASSPTLQFQQPLFGRMLNPSINVHFVSLTALPDGTSNWLDIDFVTVASENQTSMSVTGLPNTVPVPWPSSSLTAVDTTSTSTNSEAVGAVSEQGNNGSKLNTATEVLAIVFGLVIALVILILLVYWFLRRRYNRQRAKEHSFRLGKAERAAVDKLVIGAPMNFEHKESGSTDGHPTPPAPVLGPAASSQVHLLDPSANMSTASLPNKATRVRELMLAQPPPTRPPDSALPSPPHSPGFASLASSLTLTSVASGSSAVTKSSDASGKALYMVPNTAAVAGPASPTRASPFAFLSQAPVAFPMNFGAMRRGSKGDADSLKTDFLQV